MTSRRLLPTLALAMPLRAAYDQGSSTYGDTARVRQESAATSSRSWHGILLVCGLMVNPSSSYAGQQETPGHSIGQVSTTGDLIVIELDSAALGQPNLFDLVGRTLRFSPVGSSYRVTNEPLRWDTNYGVATHRC